LRNVSLTARLLSGTVLAGVVSTTPVGARAQHVWLPPVTALAATQTTDTLLVTETATKEETPEDEQVLFEADTVTRQNEESPIVAEGNVRAFFGKRYLRADRLQYNPTTDIVIAEGNVSITDEDLETVFAGRVELTGDLRDGVAENFSALLEENARLAADSAVQEQGARTRLSNAVYTACNVCDDKGKDKTPTWRIKALRVTRDRERRVVRFRHAFIELKGVPIMYAPYLQGPDPSVERQSGLLTPLIGASSRLGFNIELPYYLALSNHMDATFFPKYTSNDGVLWQGEFRRRGDRGYHVLSGGIIDFDNTEPDENNNIPQGIPGVRWNAFGRGYRDFGENWQAGYDFERVSDDAFLRRYDVRRRGDLRKELDTSNTNRLRSNAYVRWRKGGSDLTINSYLFQGLRAGDRSDLTPYVLPLIDFRHDFSNKVAGGRAHINANMASLQRTGGVDTRRFTASAFWRREHITRNGHRFEAFGELRGDTYYFQDLDEGTEIFPNGINQTDPTQFKARFAPSAGIEWSYPLTKRALGARFFIEPRVQLVASPANRNPDEIINEDSQSIEFDYGGLFEYNKSTGFDRFEDGQRMNVGVTGSAVFDNGITLEASVGEQFRIQETDAFDASTGLGEKRSDIVGSLNLRYKNHIGVENRFRLNDDNGRLQRVESQVFANIWRLNGRLNYIRLNEENTAAALVRREELTGSASFRITDHWSTGFAWRENLDPPLLLDENGSTIPDGMGGFEKQESTIRQDFILRYRDECSSLELTYRRDRTTDVGLERDTAFLVRFTLRSLVD